MSKFSNPNFDPAFRRQSAPLFNPLPPANAPLFTQPQTNPNGPYGGLLDYKWEAPTLNWGGSTTSGSGSGVGAASGASTAASKPNITPGTTPGQTPDTTKQQKPETVSVAEIGNANTIAGLIDLAAKVDRMGDGYTRRHLQTMISDKINEIRRSEKWDADRAHETKTRTHWANVKQKQAAAANPKKDLGWDGDGTATPNTQLTPSTPAPAAAPAAPAPQAAPMPDYLQALYNGEITPDQYRQLTEGGATPAAPARIRSSLATDMAKGAPRLDPGSVGFYENGLRRFKKMEKFPTSPLPPAEDEAPAPAPAPAAPAPAPATKPTASAAPMGNRQINTTDDMIPTTGPWDPTPAPVRNHPIQVAVDTVGAGAASAGNFINDLIRLLTSSNNNDLHYEPIVDLKPSTNLDKSSMAALPRTMGQDVIGDRGGMRYVSFPHEPKPNPNLSNKAKLAGLISDYSVYMHNLQNAYERGEISSDEFRRRRDAVNESYQGQRKQYEQ